MGIVFLNINCHNLYMIKKLSNGLYQVQSESGKNLGTFKSEKGAKKRLEQVEYFKHKNKN